MSYKQHAEIELKALGYNLEDTTEGPNKWMVESIMELLEVFSKQGHSGSSAPHCIALFTKLASFEPLCPLTGKDEEWVEVNKNLWQNKRCSHVFKDEKGKAWDIDGKIFVEPNGTCYTSKKSHTQITFPYIPKREYVKVDKESKVWNEN